MGTPLYMSPEQCRDSANLDFRTDLYSLGCVLYEMVTARPPFTHTTLGDLVVAHMTETPADPRTLNPTVPAPLAELIGELLRKEPAARPAGMRAVADRLGAFLGGLTTVPEPAPEIPPLPKPPAQTTFGEAASEIVDDTGPPTRRPLTFAIVGAVVVGLGIGGFIARRGHAPAPPHTKVPAAWTGTPAPALAASAVVPAPATGAAAEDKDSRARHAGKIPSGKRAVAHRALAAAAPSQSPAAPLAPMTTVAITPPPAGADAAPADVTGAWEGAWTDAEHHQHGRLYLQVGAGGAAVGWFSNANVAQSYRLTGRADGGGTFTLACDCPVNQAFTVRASLRNQDGDMRGSAHAVGGDAASSVRATSCCIARRPLIGRARLLSIGDPRYFTAAGAPLKSRPP